MPRAREPGPYSYEVIAMACGKLCLGEGKQTVARETGVSKETIARLCRALSDIRALPDAKVHSLPADMGDRIFELIRTTRLSNQEIRKRLGLTGTASVAWRRKAYHDELRATGKPVPHCDCGAEFEHRHRCRFKRARAKPLDPTDLPEALRDLQAGVLLGDLRERYSISQPVSLRLLNSLTPAQRAKRDVCLRAQTVARRRRKGGMASVGLFERLDAAVSRTMPGEVRAEVLQDMAVAILNGDITEQQAMHRVPFFSSQVYGRLGGGRWDPVSLDADREGSRLVDMIEDERAFDEFSALDELELAR